MLLGQSYFFKNFNHYLQSKENSISLSHVGHFVTFTVLKNMKKSYPKILNVSMHFIDIS